MRYKVIFKHIQNGKNGDRSKSKCLEDLESLLSAKSMAMDSDLCPLPLYEIIDSTFNHFLKTYSTLQQWQIYIHINTYILNQYRLLFLYVMELSNFHW